MINEHILRQIVLTSLLHHNPSFTHITEQSLSLLSALIKDFIGIIARKVRGNVLLARRTDVNVLDILEVMERMEDNGSGGFGGSATRRSNDDDDEMHDDDDKHHVTRQRNRGIGLRQLMRQLEIEGQVKREGRWTDAGHEDHMRDVDEFEQQDVSNGHYGGSDALTREQQNEDLLNSASTMPSNDDVFIEDAQFRNLWHTPSHIIDPSQSQHRHEDIPYLPAFPESFTYRATEHRPARKEFTELELRREAQEIEGSLTDIYMAQTNLKSLHFEDQFANPGNEQGIGGVSLDGSDAALRKPNAGIISSRPIVNPYLPSNLKNPVKVHLADIASQSFNISESVIKLIPPLVRLHDPLEHMSRWKLPKKWNEYQQRCDPSMRNVQHILRFQNPQMK